MRSLSIKKIGLIIFVCVLLLSLANCSDIRLLTNWEVEERLSRRYGQEFTVIASKSVSNADALGLWWAKVFVVSPKDDPEVQFFAFNAVAGESNNSVPGISNSLQDTYSLDIFRNAFEARAANAEVKYTFGFSYPIKSTCDFYSFLAVYIDPVSSENLETVCTVLSDAYADTLEKVPEIPWRMSVKFTYREPEWPEDQSYLVVIGSYEVEHLDISAEGIEEYILDEVDCELSS